MERCEECGFGWDEVDPAQVPGRVMAAAHRLRALLDVDADHRTRPAPDRWSNVEYACHVRDVSLNLRDRMILALFEDVPHPPSMYPAARVEAGLHALDGDHIREDLACAAGIFTRFTQALPDRAWQRRLTYPWPRQQERTLAWVGAHTVHEWEHHGDDIAAGVLTGLDRLFHIVSRQDWDRGEPELTGSTRGRTLSEEGFVHLATPAQVAGVLDRYYPDVRQDVVVLELDPRALPAGRVRLDLVGDRVFPHLYAPLPRSAVRAARPAPGGGAPGDRPVEH